MSSCKEQVNYWLHRCAKHGPGFQLLQKNILSIGFSDLAQRPEIVKSIHNGDWETYCKQYGNAFGGALWRARHDLWKFAHVMKPDDVVVVPTWNAFSICRIVSDAKVAEDFSGDIGWVREVEILAQGGPRPSYATASLLSRMKARQTTLWINDLADHVECALQNMRNKTPFSLTDDLAKKCKEILVRRGNPDLLERLICDYFKRQGAIALIPSKNARDKEGDCDIEAVFPALKLTVFVQAKFHGVQARYQGEKTGKFAVEQILDYAAYATKREDGIEDLDWTYANWVVSFADFTDDAKELAKGNGVILLNSDEFCKMLVENGVGL